MARDLTNNLSFWQAMRAREQDESIPEYFVGKRDGNLVWAYRKDAAYYKRRLTLRILLASIAISVVITLIAITGALP